MEKKSLRKSFRSYKYKIGKMVEIRNESRNTINYFNFRYTRPFPLRRPATVLNTNKDFLIATKKVRGLRGKAALTGGTVCSGLRWDLI